MKLLVDAQLPRKLVNFFRDQGCDADFVSSFLLRKQPQRLLLISTGNIRNADLQLLLATHWIVLKDALEHFNFTELTRTSIIIHE